VGGEFADKEFQNWLGCLDGDIQREIPKYVAHEHTAFCHVSAYNHGGWLRLVMLKVVPCAWSCL
jgi:hypothetical protein